MAGVPRHWLHTLFHHIPSYTRLYPSSPSSTGRRRRVRVVKLGSGKSWRIKRIPKIRLRWFSPIRILAKIRDGYVKFMLAASSKMYSPELVMGNFGVYGTAKPFGEVPIKEYDKRFVLELYRSSLTQGELAFARS